MVEFIGGVRRRFGASVLNSASSFPATFGRVPFFYYVVHIYLIHALAVATAFAITGALATTPEINFSLTGVYIVWLMVVVLLYPICRWFSELKEKSSGWWWTYL